MVEQRDSRAGGREECRRGSRVRYAGHVLPRSFSYEAPGGERRKDISGCFTGTGLSVHNQITEVCKPGSQIWPSTCVCNASEVRMVFIFLGS